MADRDPEQENLFKEIDEDLRQERYAELWKQYGKYVIGAAVLLVAAVGGYQWWQAHDLTKRAEQSAAFTAALRAIDQDNRDQATTILAEVAKIGGGGYAVLSRLNQAAQLGQSGDRATAAAVYFQLADDSGIDPIFRGLATILGTLQDLDNGNPQALSQRLAPYLAGDSPWRYSAKELTALLAKRSGDAARAETLFKELADDATAPAGIRARAAEMTAILGS